MLDRARRAHFDIRHGDAWMSHSTAPATLHLPPRSETIPALDHMFVSAATRSRHT